MTQADVADILLRLGAVEINAREPFMFTSGTKSPIYCDNRLIISHPDERRLIVDGLTRTIEESLGRGSFDIIAGTATAGIPWASWVAERLDKPMIYVRSEAKGHGRGRQIEGRLHPGQSVVVVEDLVTTGGSLLGTVRAIRAGGGRVSLCVAIFTYGLAKAEQACRDEDVEMAAISNIGALLRLAVEEHALTADDKAKVEAWLREQV